MCFGAIVSSWLALGSDGHSGIWSVTAFLCARSGKTHVHHRPPGPYRAVELASEPVTGERWLEVPDATVGNVDEDYRLHFFPLEPGGMAGADEAGQMTAGRSA